MTILLIALIGLLLSVAYGFVGNRLMQHGRLGFKPRFFEFAFFYGVVAFFWLLGAPEKLIIIIVGSGLVTMVTMYPGNPERAIAIGYTNPWSVLHTLACVVYIVAIIYGVVKCFTGF
jgi:hypothetical protein